MKGMNIAVVGGASGFGLETVKLMIRDGAAKIAIIDINQESLDAAKEELSGKGTEIFTVAGDIARAEHAHASFNAAVADLGVNRNGIFTPFTCP
ncbi:SDR family oxidoreductase, partial [Falsochrobactrum sp. TDYN1]